MRAWESDFLLASAVWYFVSESGPSAWRWMFVIGILPALATLWIRRGISEPEKWSASNRLRQAAIEAREPGQRLDEESQHYARLTIVDLFADQAHAPHHDCGALDVVHNDSDLVGDFRLGAVLCVLGRGQAGSSAAKWASFGGMAYNIGAIAGYVGFGFCADAWGRKPVTMAWFIISWLLTPVLFLWTHQLYLILLMCAVNAVFSLGQYTWCSTWLPEVISDAHTRNRGFIRLQRAQIRGFPRSFGCRNADYLLRRVWQGCCDLEHNLSAGDLRGAVLSRNQRQAAAGIEESVSRRMKDEIPS